jgi:uncharacterized protein (DUF2062 family)
MNAAPRPRLTVPRKFFRKYLPDAAAVRSNRLVAMFGGFLRHPNLWHLNRRSVSRAVGIGLFSGLVPGPLQMLSALLLAIPLRANLPVALLMTFYTNPFTIVPLYLVAFAYGRFLLQENHQAVEIVPFEMDWGNLLQSFDGMVEWSLQLGRPLAVGLVALALTLGVAGTLLTRLAWRFYAVAAWQQRRRKRDRVTRS